MFASNIGYTDEEKDRLYDLIDNLASQYFSETGDWEESIREISIIVAAKALRQYDVIEAMHKTGVHEIVRELDRRAAEVE